MYCRGFTTISLSRADCFNALGVPPGSSEQSVKDAYRKLAKIHHPDLGGNTDKFVKIQKAYEGLMDGSLRMESQKSEANSSGANRAGYWSSWDAGGTWWKESKSSSYSEKDFEAEFERDWQRFNKTKRSQFKRGFRAKSKTDEESAEESGGGSSGSQEDCYKREKEESIFNGGHSARERVGRKEKKFPEKILLSCDREFTDSLTGEYSRVSKFNGRACFSNSTSGVFLFWSNRNKDWKISKCLKDDGNCLAFNDRIHPSIDYPFRINESARWMVWNDRARRYLPAKLKAVESSVDYASWTGDQLKEALLLRGLQDKVSDCYEKHELEELMRLYGHLKPSEKPTLSSAQDPIPEGYFRICSRQRHDGVVQSPPVLNDRCRVGRNRVESYCGPVEKIEEWLLKHGDRRRYYGVFDSERNFCFGLIWKNNKAWGRAGVHDW